MKIIGLEIKKIRIGKFFPREDRLELDIFFNDGNDKEIFKIVSTSDPERAAENILAGLRRLEKNIHNSRDSELIADNFVNIVVKNEDMLIKEISGFIQKAGSKMDKIKGKNVAEGYLDIIRELKSLEIDLTKPRAP